MNRRDGKLTRAAALALAAALLACRGGGDGAAADTKAGGAAAAPQPVKLARENVAVVAERTLQSGPDISGTLRAKRAASIRAEVGGAVSEVLADAGQRVKEGQLLARIDAPALADAVVAARSGLSAAKNNLQVAESSARRARTLAEAGALAAQDAERAEAQLEGARAQLADAQARVASAEQQAGKIRVRAPFGGVVSERAASAGDVVASGSALFTVIDPSRLQFDASVPAARIGAVRPGAAVDFTVTGFGERAFQGRIERVNPAVDPATGQVRVYVDVPNEDGRLISGLYAQGRVATESATVLAAPASAVDQSSTPATVMRVVDGKVEKVAVTLGLRDDVAGAVGLRSGVKAGDVLVLGSARGTLAEGAPVHVAQDGGARGEEKKSN
jgi:membrane fusion protein, multidrug efflux system